MGGGNTKTVPADAYLHKPLSRLDEKHLCKVFLNKSQLKSNMLSASNQWEIKRIIQNEEYLNICEAGSENNIVAKFNLELDIHFEEHHVDGKVEFSLRQDDLTLIVCLDDEEAAMVFAERIRKCVIAVKGMVFEGAKNGMQSLLDILDHVPCLPSLENDEKLLLSKQCNESPDLLSSRPATPIMKIVILVVGTRGDVSPFVNLGLALKDMGHDVRIGTHREYRNMVMTEDLKFYPLEGDPRKLSEYMVKTGGRLIPDLTSSEERKSLPEKMQMLKDITYSTWPACTCPDPEDEASEPFVAEAIISNPVSYGHIHCAEALCVPLHIMFPQPWYPTKCFPHPLANMAFDNKWSIKNKMSYDIVDEFMWIGLRSMINDFRTDVLQLQPYRIGEGGESALENNEVPISHMWSPSFVPRCSDWPIHVDVVGDFIRSIKSPPTYDPDPRLQAFLDENEHAPPIFVGFGSMVIADPTALVNIIKQASLDTGCKVVFQSGWTKYAEDYEMLNENVMVVGSMSHDWLFSKVSAVVHHGGAGTTSAGLRAGCPTFICPFFGDQHFWAEMVSRSGAGPPGCPIKNLTVETLVKAIHFLKKDDTVMKVKQLSTKMNAENGVAEGVKSFNRNLPIVDMLCEVSIFGGESKIAKVYCSTCGLKMSEEVDTFVHRKLGGREDHLRMNYRCVKWGVSAPSSILEGIGQGLGSFAYEFAGGVKDFVSTTFGGNVKGGVKALIARPGIGGSILVEKVKQAFQDDDGSSRKRTHTVDELCQRGRTAYDFDPVQLDGLLSRENKKYCESAMSSEEDLSDRDKKINKNYVTALNFKKWCDKLDADKDRHIELEELKSYMSEDDALDFIRASDINQDGELCIAEMALNFIKKGYFNPDE